MAFFRDLGGEPMPIIDPGEIKPAGAPSGVFVDNAQSLITRAIPRPTRADTRKAILAAIAEANRWGLTGIHDPGEDAETISIYEELARGGNYNLRNYVMLSDPGEPGTDRGAVHMAAHNERGRELFRRFARSLRTSPLARRV